jgi:hypothetical protein
MQKVDKTVIVLEKQLSRTLHGAQDNLHDARDRKDETILYSTYIKMCSHSGIKLDLNALSFLSFTANITCEPIAYASATCYTATSYGALGETTRVQTY